MADSKSLFLLLGYEKIEGTEKIKNDILKHAQCDFEIVPTAKVLIERMSATKVACVLFYCRRIDNTVLDLLRILRKMNDTTSLIAMTHSAAKESYEATRNLKRMVVLEVPYKELDLALLCNKILKGEEIYHRKHERFDTKQEAEIQKVVTKEKFKGWVRNMSRGGAFLEVPGKFKEGDLLMVVIQLEQLDKVHELHGEAVRVTPDCFGPGVTGIGIRFISPEDLYLALLEKA